MKILVSLLLLVKFCSYIFISERTLFKSKQTSFLLGSEIETLKETLEGNKQDYLVSIIPATQKFQKYETQIKHFVNALEERPHFDGYIIYMSSNQLSKQKVNGFVRKLMIYLETRHKIDVKRLRVEYGGKRRAASFDLYVMPPRPRSQ